MKFFVIESHHVIKSFVILIYFITNNSLVLVCQFMVKTTRAKHWLHSARLEM